MNSFWKLQVYIFSCCVFVNFFVFQQYVYELKLASLKASALSFFLDLQWPYFHNIMTSFTSRLAVRLQWVQLPAQKKCAKAGWAFRHFRSSSSHKRKSTKSLCTCKYVNYLESGTKFMSLRGKYMLRDCNSKMEIAICFCLVGFVLFFMYKVCSLIP